MDVCPILDMMMQVEHDLSRQAGGDNGKFGSRDHHVSFYVGLYNGWLLSVVVHA